jgi:hypothetical protein
MGVQFFPLWRISFSSVAFFPADAECISAQQLYNTLVKIIGIPRRTPSGENIIGTKLSCLWLKSELQRIGDQEYCSSAAEVGGGFKASPGNQVFLNCVRRVDHAKDFHPSSATIEF